jgi:hypothetical protein
VIEDRHGTASKLLTGQLPIEKWHEHIGDPTIADASRPQRMEGRVIWIYLFYTHSN